ncbi:hypothetical protein DV737_g2093, partial [Chaetothyriales sp. CBS 132003]
MVALTLQIEALKREKREDEEVSQRDREAKAAQRVGDIEEENSRLKRTITELQSKIKHLQDEKNVQQLFMLQAEREWTKEKGKQPMRAADDIMRELNGMGPKEGGPPPNSSQGDSTDDLIASLRVAMDNSQLHSQTLEHNDMRDASSHRGRAARIAYLASDVVLSVQPPSAADSAFSASLRRLAATKAPNLVSKAVPEVVTVGQNADPLLAAYHPLSEGKLVSVTTSSAILLHAVPHLYKLAEYPIVLHVALAFQQPDFSEISSIRQSGFAFLQSETLQEAQDIALTAHALAARSGKGVIHFFDPTNSQYDDPIPTESKELVDTLLRAGGRSAHHVDGVEETLYAGNGRHAALTDYGLPSLAPVRAGSEDQIPLALANGTAPSINSGVEASSTTSFGRDDSGRDDTSESALPSSAATTATTAESPVSRPVTGSDVFSFASDIWALLGQKTGRVYAPIEYSGPPDTEAAVFIFGSTGVFVDVLDSDDVPLDLAGVGIITARLYRPWLGRVPFLDSVPRTIKKIAVLEQIRRKTTKWGPSYLDLLSSLSQMAGGGEQIQVVQYRLGLVEPSTALQALRAVFQNLAPVSTPRKHSRRRGHLAAAHIAVQNLTIGEQVEPTVDRTPVEQPALEDAYVKMLNQLFSTRLYLANAANAAHAGLSPSVAASPEYGLGSLLARIEHRKRFVNEAQDSARSKEFITDNPKQWLSRWALHAHDTLKANEIAPEVIARLANDGSRLSTRLLDSKALFFKESQWLIGSDAWAYDLGNSGVHHLLASGANVNMLIIDSQPYSARASADASRRKKDIGLYAMNFGNAYVASVAVYGSYTQVLEAMIEADKFDGPSIILAYLPYNTVNDSPLTVLQETKKAVDLGYWPLYRWDPSRGNNGDPSFSLDSERIKKELEDFLRRDNQLTQLMNRHPRFAANLSESYGSEVRKLQIRKAKDAYEQMLEGLYGAPLTILFASDNGNAEGLAKRLANRGKARGLKTTLFAMDDFPLEDLPGEENVVFITSTAGQGEFPQNGRAFWDAIKDAADLDLSNLRYSVFALGDSHYWPRKEDKIFYNKPGKDLDARVKFLGAKALAEVGLGDDQDPDAFQTAYQEWEPKLWQALDVANVEGLPEEPPPVTNEDIKLASNYLRGTIAEGLRDTSTGAISAADSQLTKFHGTYMQDDRDVRDERKAQGLEPAYSFMIRCRLPGGVATPSQWLQMDAIASNMGNETMKLTTRQTFQFHGVIKSKLRPAMQAINKALMTTIAACGDVNRNVMCSSLPTQSHFHQEVHTVAKRISDHLLPSTTAYHEIWLKDDETGEKTQVAGDAVQDFEPLYGPTYLPRKFKITIAVPPRNDTDVYAHDIGLIAIRNSRSHDLEGFNVLAGGGMGVTHNNKKTYPRTGYMLGYVPAAQAHLVCEKILLVQRDHGDRKNRKHARLKYTMDDMGNEVFKAKVQDLLDQDNIRFEAPRPFKFETNIDAFGWQKDELGLNHFTFFIENGRVENTSDFPMRSGLVELARLNHGEFRLTGNQHLIMSNISDSMKPRVLEIMKKYKLDNAQLSGLRKSSSACVAFPTCGLAMAESERYLPEFITKLESCLEENGLGQESIVFRMTGCPNGCARPWVAEAAFVGKAYGAYNIYLGGGYHGQRLNKLYRSSVMADECVEIMKSLIARYAKERQEKEHFGDWCIRSGVINETTEGKYFHDNTAEVESDEDFVRLSHARFHIHFEVQNRATLAHIKLQVAPRRSFLKPHVSSLSRRCRALAHLRTFRHRLDATTAPATAIVPLILFHHPPTADALPTAQALPPAQKPPSLRTSVEQVAPMSESSSPLGPTAAARRPGPAPTKVSGLSSDLQARMKAFSLSRQGAPPSQGSRSPALVPQQPAGGPFIGGALTGAQPGAQQFGRLPPQLSRANAPSLNSPSPSQGSPRVMSPQPKPGGLAAKRGLKPGGMKLSDVLKPAEDGQGQQKHDTGSQFSKFQNIVDTQKGTLNFKDKAVIHGSGIEFEGGGTFSISLDEIDPIDELGKGNYGTVFRVRHARPKIRKPGLGIRGAMNKSIAAQQQQSQSPDGDANATTGLVMAMKEIRLELEDTKFAQIIMELDILHRCVSPFIIDFYGAFFQEGSVYICIEYMDGGSIDKLYGDGVPEGVLRKITSSTVLGLKTLKDDYNIIHRDVKPTNILVNTKGQVKICDFGVSGNLVASIAKTNIGCQSYMAPERISGGGMASSGASGGTYSVQSDVWSLGLTIIECALGRYPYPPETYDNIFSQLSAIVEGEPPSLPADSYSPEAIDFVRKCLHKVPKMRPTYAMLLRHPWLAPLMKPPTISEDEEAEAAAEAGGCADGSVDTTSPATADKEVADWVKAALEKKLQGKLKFAKKPALHEAPLDAVPGSALMGNDEAPSYVQDEDRIKPNPGVRLNSPELRLAQVESVAQIFGKPIYVVTDVTLLPLSSQRDASSAITSAIEAKKSSEPATDSESTDSEPDGREYTSGSSSVNSSLPDDSKDCTIPKSEPSPSIAQNVYNKRAQFGTFASQWFSRRGWSVGPTTDSPDATSSEANDAHDSSAGDAEAATTASRNKTIKADEDTLTDTPLLDGSSSIRALTSKISRNTHSFLIPVIQGFVGQRTFNIKKPKRAVDPESASSVALKASGDEDHATQPEGGVGEGRGEENERLEPFLLTIISRRSTKRSGLRYLRRGIDDEGNCANSVETEQVLSAPDWDRSKPIHSFVQIRASIPLFFSQSPYSFKPLPQFHRSQLDNDAAFRRHFSDLKAKYGGVQIDLLVDKHGTEVAIGQAYEDTFKRLREDGDTSVDGLDFEWFDFHAECRGMKFENVSKLVEKLKAKIDEFGETVLQDGVQQKIQSGIVRTNCMDCLDRTNVVESALGQYMLQTALSGQGFEIDLVSDQSTTWFNTLWADNGDAISRQYAGTAALKGDFTRTRKRNMQGAMFDFSLTLTRYYKNMFNDYFSQAVIDLLLGNLSWKAFEEFEATMKTADPGISIAKVRENAVETCRKVAIQDEQEEMIQYWTVLAPAYENTLRTLPFQEAVLLLTDAALYCCRFDWTTEKVASYERVDLRSITKIRYGTYIVSTVTEGQMNEQTNVGLVVAYRPGKESVLRTNTRSLQTHVEPNLLLEDRIDGGTGILSWSQSRSPQPPQALAVKIIPPASDDYGNHQSRPSTTTPLSIAQEYCREIERAIVGGPEAKGSPDSTKVLIEEGDIISLAEAKRRTGYLEQIGYSIKKFFTSNLRKHTYSHQSSLPTPSKDQKIFICAQFWTSANIIQTRWGDALLKLIDTLGPEHVYVSIYESGSLDNTKAILSQLDSKLAEKNVARTTVLDPESHADLIRSGPFDSQGNPRSGWVLPPSGSDGKEFRRIPHLAKTRNLSLQPLLEEKKHGRTYDKVLFLSDVVFKPHDVLSLLATNGGSYSVACAIDYHFPARLATLYDTFALRDSNGDRALAVHFPYFKSDESREALLRGDSAKVQSCWNGMVLMDASPFYSSVNLEGEVVDGLRFRAIGDSLAAKHLEASECCLIHADLTAMGAAQHGIYINPAVRVGYTEKAYNLTHTGPEAGFITSSHFLV